MYLSRGIALAWLAVLLGACSPVDINVDPEKFKCRWQDDATHDTLDLGECNNLIAAAACTFEAHGECDDDEDCNNKCLGKDCTRTCLGNAIPVVNCSFGDVTEEVCRQKVIEFNCATGKHIPANVLEQNYVDQCYAYRCREFTCPR